MPYDYMLDEDQPEYVETATKEYVDRVWSEYDEECLDEDTLQAFYNAYAIWLDYVNLPWYKQMFRSKPQHAFVYHLGLCGNASSFFFKRGCVPDRAYKMLGEQFKEAGLNMHFPFNDSGIEFGNETRRETMHKNKRRNDWVHAHVRY